MNLCGSCGQDFSSVEAFDRHRVGIHEYSFEEGLLLSPRRTDGRRCFGIEEMAASGWVLDARGRWVHPRELRKRLRRGGDRPTAPIAAAPPSRRPLRAPDDLSEPITARGRRS
jgi:hypothetical protein